MNKDLILSKRLRALPVSFSENKSNFFIRRGATVIQLPKNSANELVGFLLSAFDTPDGVEVESVLAGIPENKKTSIVSIIEKLFASRLLAETETFNQSTDKAFDVFCWDHGTNSEIATSWVEQHVWSFIGSSEYYNHFSILTEKLGVKIDFIDANDNYVSMLNEAKKNLQENCNHVIFTLSESGDAQLLREINQWAITNKSIFYPLSIIDYTGHLGPIIVPKETACYECLRARENAAMFELEARRAAQANLNIESVSYPPLLPAVILTTAVSNAIRFFSNLSIPDPNAVQRIDLMSGKTTQHKVLEIPWCKVCGSNEELARMASRPLKIFKDEVIS